MPRTRLTYIYFIVVNLLLFHLLLDIPREVAYRFERFGHEWYGVGIIALATLMVLAHLVAFVVSLAVYGVLKGLNAVRPGRRVLEAVRPFELAVFLAFLYVNVIYFYIFVGHFQAWLLGMEAYALTRIKTALLFAASVGSVVLFYRYKARILRFLETRLSTFSRVATASLVMALGLTAGQIAWGYSSKGRSCPVASNSIIQSYADYRMDKRLPNVIVLTFDGLTAENMSLYGYFRNTTPFLDELSKKCTVFTNIKTISKDTIPSLLTLLLGKGPQTWGPRQKAGFVHEQDNAENLLRILETLGYSIRVASAFGWGANKSDLYCPGIYPGLQFRSPSNRFKGRWRFLRSTFTVPYRLLDYRSLSLMGTWISNIEYLHDIMLGRVRRGTWKIAGRPLPVHKIDTVRQQMETDFFLPFLEQELRITKEPTFLWIHSAVPHPMFEPPPPYFGRYLKSQDQYSQIKAKQKDTNTSITEISKMLRARYDEFILYMDAGIAEALKIIKRTEFLNPWLLLITADHGSRTAGIPDASQEETFHIPLIVCEQNQAGGQRIQAPGGTLDFAPTILELVGVEPPDWMEGKSLVRFMEKRR